MLDCVTGYGINLTGDEPIPGACEITGPCQAYQFVRMSAVIAPCGIDICLWCKHHSSRRHKIETASRHHVHITGIAESPSLWCLQAHFSREDKTQ